MNINLPANKRGRPAKLSPKSKRICTRLILSGECRSATSIQKKLDMDNIVIAKLFKKNFSDPSQEIRARGELRRCKQGPRSLANYDAEFRTSARISGFDQAALIDQFLRGLNDNVMNFLMMNDMPTKLEDTIALAVKVDNRLSNRRMLRSAPGYYNSSFQRPITKAEPVQSTMHDDLPPGEPMEIDALVPNSDHISLKKKRTDAELLGYACIWKSRTYSYSLSKQNSVGKSPHSVIPGKLLLGSRYLFSVNNLTDSLRKFTFPIKLSYNNITVPIIALIDSGATGNFIQEKLAKRLNLPRKPISQHIELETIDGNKITGSPITETCIGFTLTLSNNHCEEISLLPINSIDIAIVLGLPWLRKHNPQIHWINHSLSFNSNYCVHNCISNPKRIDTVFRAPIHEHSDIEADRPSSPDISSDDEFYDAPSEPTNKTQTESNHPVPFTINTDN
ncbi:Retrotransposon-derived protein PEG10, partial [Zancudomyces culisetae]